METEKIEFWRGRGFDMSRTRATDRRAGIQYDRVVAWLREENVYVVFDIVKFLETGYFTLANLFHTTTVLEEGEGYRITSYNVCYTKLLRFETSAPGRASSAWARAGR